MGVQQHLGGAEPQHLATPRCHRHRNRVQHWRAGHPHMRPSSCITTRSWPTARSRALGVGYFSTLLTVKLESSANPAIPHTFPHLPAIPTAHPAIHPPTQPASQPARSASPSIEPATGPTTLSGHQSHCTHPPNTPAISVCQLAAAHKQAAS